MVRNTWVTLGRNLHVTTMVNQEVGELVDLVEETKSVMNIIRRKKILKESRMLEKQVEIWEARDGEGDEQEEEESE